MKIVINSKFLADKLNDVDIEKNPSYSIVPLPKGVSISFGDEQKIIPCERMTGNINDYLSQENANWDWIKKIVNQVDSQPCVLNIKHNSVSIEFQC